MSFLPPGVQSGTLAAFPQIAYDRTAIMEWQFNTPALEELCDFRPLPRRSGRTIQFYGQQPYVASTTTLSEGIPGPSLSLSQVFSDAYADEYGDWIGISNVAQAMFLADITLDAARNLSYRGALTSNLVAFNAFEAAATAQSAARIDLQDNEFLLSNTIRKAEAQLVGNAVPVRDGGMYTSVAHPFMTYDMFSDNSAGSAVDTLKRSSEGASVLKGGISRGYQVLEWSGMRIIRTQTVPAYANYPSNGKTGYAMYFVGREAMLASELLGQKAPRNPSFRVNVKTFGDNDIDLSNPMLQTRAIVSYDWFLGVVARPNTNGTPGFRRVRGEVSAV
jgi:N4-gp56 family major capsid protein